MALVQKLTLDPKHEKPDPAELDKIREEYRQQLASQSQQKQQQQQAQALVKAEQQAPQNPFELGEEGDDLESDQVQQQPQQPQHEQQPNQEPAGTELSEAVIEKLEMLQRYEARFPGEKTNGDIGSSHFTTSNQGKKKKEGRKEKERGRMVDDNDCVNDGVRTVVLYPQRGTLSPAATV